MPVARFACPTLVSGIHITPRYTYQKEENEPVLVDCLEQRRRSDVARHRKALVPAEGCGVRLHLELRVRRVCRARERRREEGKVEAEIAEHEAHVVCCDPEHVR